MNEKLIVILGPTAVGKTRFSVRLADKFNGEIISADSRQVYQYMDIGTGKDIDDYKIGNRKIPYHLIDVIEPTEEFDLFHFRKLFKDAFEKIISKNHVPFLVGGTGLYIHSILKNYQMAEVEFDTSRYKELDSLPDEKLREMVIKKLPDAHNTTDLIEKTRMIKAIMIAEQKESTAKNDDFDFPTLVIGLKDDREKIKENITKRLMLRLQSGMIEEVESLINSGIPYEKLDFFGLEYKFIGRYLKGDLNYNDMYQKLNSAIHKFAKRQMTWFRKMEREGINIHWIEKGNEDTAYIIIENFLTSNR